MYGAVWKSCQTEFSYVTLSESTVSLLALLLRTVVFVCSETAIISYLGKVIHTPQVITILIL